MHALVADHLDALTRLCRTHRVRRLFLFGSGLDETFDTSRSDLDFLAEFEPQERRGLEDVYFQLLGDLESLFGRRIDLVEDHCLRNPYVRRSVDMTKRVIYAAA